MLQKALGGTGMRWLVFASREFVTGGVCFGVFIGLLNLSITAGVLAGLAFGGLFSLATTALTAIVVGRRPGSLSTQQRALLTMRASTDVAHDRAVAAIAGMPAVVTFDDAFRVIGRTKVSWKSWGEILTINLRAGDRATHVEVMSRPRLRGTVVDYGLNDRNVVRLAQALERPTQ